MIQTRVYQRNSPEKGLRQAAGSRDSAVRLGESLILLSILSACGGGRGGSESSGTSGKVIDGYIAGARVFRDANGNNRYDLGEDFSVTNGSGYFSGLRGSSSQTIVVDGNGGTAYDTVTGFPLSFTMASPGDYEVITPITTLVVALEDRGLDRAEAEAALKQVLGISDAINLKTYDPFSDASGGPVSGADFYKSTSVKIANVLMAGDNDFGSNNIASYAATVANFAQLIENKYLNNQTMSLSRPDDLKSILPSTSSKIISQLADAHSFSNYLEILDGQLIFLASNFGSVLRSDTQYGDELVYVEIAIELNTTITPGHAYEAKLTNARSGLEVSSTDLVAAGSRVAIFRFTDNEIRSLGDGNLEVGLTDLTVGVAIEVNNSVNLEVLAPTDLPPPVSTPQTTTTNQQIVQEELPTDDGIVADGYISGARVFRDENENGQFDPGEESVTTNSSGEFTGLGGSSDKPIVADGNGGTAVDTSTGSVFNAVLSAPAGSKVVNPVTTIVNELLQDNTSGVTTVAEANLKVAKVFGMEAVTSAGIDFTKFDPIARKTYSDDGESTAILDDNLADITQGVATFVANLIVSGAAEKSREAGGDATVLANTTKAIIGNIKDLVKTRSAAIEGGDPTQKFDYSKSTDIREAMGTDLFDATSTTLSTVGDSFSSFNPKSYVDNTSATTGLINQTSLLEKQILSQSEFGDGVLTTSEASDGSTYVIGPLTGEAFTGSATVQFTGDVIRYKSVTFSNSKYATLDLSAPDAQSNQDNILKDIGGGSIAVLVKQGVATTGAEWDALGETVFTDSTYFHKDITPSISFNDGGMTPAAGKVITASDNGTTFTLSGSVTIDLGSGTIAPVKINKIASGLSTSDGDDGRPIILEFVKDGNTVYSLEASVTRSNDAASSAQGSESFSWSVDITDTTASTNGGGTFADLNDGSYTIRGTFVDAYGATSNADTSVYNALTINRDAPEPTFQTITKTQINAADQSSNILIELSEPAADRTDQQNLLIEIVDDSSTGTRTLKQAIDDGDATATFNASNTVLTINYAPSGEGNVNVNVKPGAFLDEIGNGNTNSVNSSAEAVDGVLTVSSQTVGFDFDAPSVSTIEIANNAKSITSVNPLNSTDFDDVNTDDLELVVTFDSPVTSFSKDDVTFSRIANEVPLQISGDFASSNSGATWTAKLSPTSGLEGATTVSVLSGSYTDAFGNPGGGKSSAFSIDTKAPEVFSVEIDPSTVQTSYGISELGVSDKLDIVVTFDEALGSRSASNPVIALTGFTDGNPRYATLIQSVSDIESADPKLSSLTFRYEVDPAAKTEDGIIVASAISGGSLSGINGNAVSLDLSSVSEPLDLSSRTVDGSTAGALVDGYIEGGIVFADNDGDSALSGTDPIAQADATGGFEILGATGALVLEGGFDISTNKDFNVRYSAPAGYSVINPITTLIIKSAGADLSLSNIALKESEIYDAIGGPLGADVDVTPAQVVGDGDSFAITPSDISADGVMSINSGSWSSDDIGKYISDGTGEALLLDAAGSYRLIQNFAENTSEISYGNWSLVNKKSGLLKTYNAYEAIAEASEGTGDVGSIKDVVDQALNYQKAAASIALIVDVLSTASESVASETRTAAEISDHIFTALTGANLDALMTAIGSAAAQSFYVGGVLQRNVNDTLINTISTTLKGIFDPSVGPSPVAAVSTIAQAFPELFDVLATSIVGINAAKSKDLNAYTEFNGGAGLARSDAEEAERLAVAEDGINALTEIVQVQSVVQGDITSEIVNYFSDLASITTDITPSSANSDGRITRADALDWEASQVGHFISGNGGVARLTDTDGNYEIIEPFSDATALAAGTWSASSVNPMIVSVDRLLGVDGDPSNDNPTDYVDVSVGTVVPIRYSIEEPAQITKFEGDASGLASDFSFVITRAGSIKTTSSLEYEIFGSVSSEDISGGALSGELFFGVNEKQKTLVVSLNNDTLREPDETLSVRIFDPTETSQIVNDRASVIVRDDDPSVPEVSIARTAYEVSEGGTIIIDDINLDYFDRDAKFKLVSASENGNISTTVGGTNYTEGTFVNYFDLQTAVLRNLEFNASSSPTNSSGASILTITASETGNQANLGRSSTQTIELSYDIHRLPTLDISDLNTAIGGKTFYAGRAQALPGISVSDIDSEFLSVTIRANAGVEFSTTANVAIDNSVTNEVRIEGAKASVQAALDGLTLSADKSNETGVTLTILVDDGDDLHERVADGTLSHASTNAVSNAIVILPSPPVINQTFEPKLTVDLDVNANVWGSFPGIQVEDVDSEIVEVVVFGDAAKVDFRLFDAANQDGSGVVAFSTLLDGTKFVSINGTPEDVSNQLKLLQVEIQQKQTGLAEVFVSDGVSMIAGYDGALTPSSNSVNGTFSLGNGQVWDVSDVGKIIAGNGGFAKLLATDGSYQIIKAFENGSSMDAGSWGKLSASELVYTPIDNIVPEPGGQQTSTGITEGVADFINISGFNLVDRDAFEEDDVTPILPDKIRVQSVEGGTLSDIVDPLTGAPVDIQVDNLLPGATGLFFTPDPYFNGTAVIEYVVVDPEQATYTSATSEILVPVASVNDRPVVTISTRPLSFEQGQGPTTIFGNVNISDVDGDTYTEVTVSSDISASAGDLSLIAPDFLGITPETTSDGSTVTYSGSFSVGNIKTLLSNIKFNNTSDDIGGLSRNFTLVVKDADEDNALESNPVTKTMTLIDVNDAPRLQGSALVASFDEAAPGETQTGVALSSFGTISDPEGDAISQIKVKISSGYKIGQDYLEYTGQSSLVTGTQSVGVAETFDASTGTLIVSFEPALDVSLIANNILGDISYVNNSDNPNPVDRKLTIEITDVGGASRTYDAKTITVTPLNDAPEIFSIAADTEITSGSGGQYIENGQPTKVASDLRIRDVDSRLLDAATVTTSNGTLGLTKSGESLASAYGITYQFVSGTLTLDAVAGAQRDQMESVLREVTIGDLSRTAGEETSTQVVSFNVTDFEGAQSNVYTSNVKILAAPSVQVADVTGGGGDYAELPAGSTKVLKFNDTFFASELVVNLEQSSIRTELGRYIYDAERNTNKLSEAKHIDLREMSASVESAVTTVIGQTDEDVIYGSAFSDFIDGNGGSDTVLAGDGDDTVPLRTDATLILDGGEGSDTLLLRSNFTGSLDLANINIPGASVTISNFENIDARSVSTSVTLSGSGASNALYGGIGDDTLKMGAGGDILEGGAGADTFEIDIAVLPTTGSFVRDLKSNDIIKITNGGQAYLIDRWLYGDSVGSTLANDGLTDAWIAKDTASDRYAINIEYVDAQGSYSVKSVDIGPDIFGTPGKWVLTESPYFQLQPKINAPATFSVSDGPTTSLNKPLVLPDNGGVFNVALNGGSGPSETESIQVNDPDNDLTEIDTLTVSLSVSGEQKFIVASISDTDGSVLNTSAGDVRITGTQAQVNSSLGTLQVSETALGRGLGTLSVNVRDAYTAEADMRVYTFEVPNSAPELTLGAIKSEYSSALDVGTIVSLGDTGLLTASSGYALTDDLQDLADYAVDMRISFTGATPVVIGSEFVQLLGNDVIIRHDGSSEISGGWAEALSDLAKDIAFTRTSVGDVGITVSVEDSSGLSHQSTSETFSFKPSALKAPELIFGRYPGQEVATGENEKLSGDQFEGGSLRISLLDDGGASIGAGVGDTLRVTVEGTSGTPITVDRTIPASATATSVAVPFLDFNLIDLLPTGSASDTTLTVSATLVPLSAPGSTSTSPNLVFDIDRTDPSTPEVQDIRIGETYHVVNGEISSITVDTGVDNSVELLDLAVVNIQSGATAPWFELQPTKVVKPGTTGRFQGEVTPGSVSVDGSQYTLNFTSQLVDGVYAVVARDAVRNVSEVSLSSFDLASITLPRGIFVVDNQFASAPAEYEILSTDPSATDTYSVFKHSSDEAKQVVFNLNLAGADLPLDLAELRIDAWSGNGAPDTEAEANISAVFTRSVPGSGEWSQQSGTGVVLSGSNALQPTIALDTETLTAISDTRLAVKFTLVDTAGNISFSETLADEIQFDRDADAPDAVSPNGGYVTTLAGASEIVGISPADAAAGLSFTITGIDTDVVERKTHFVTSTEFVANLQNLGAKDPTSLQPDPTPLDVSGVKYLSFDGGTVHLDLASAIKVTDTFDTLSTGSISQIVDVVLDDILPAAGSPDEALFIIHELTDAAGNVSFRGDILPAANTSDATLEALRLDVKDPEVLEGISLGENALNDTGVLGDLVTANTRPEFSFNTDEAIQSARLILVGSDPKVGVDLVINELSPNSYSATIVDGVSLSDGAWALEVTDLVGNTKQVPTGNYGENVDLVTATDGIFVVDTSPPGDAEISVVGLSASDLFLNADDTNSTVAISATGARDEHLNAALAAEQIAVVKTIAINGTTLSVDTDTALLDATPLEEGDHQVSVTTEDVAGNQTVTTLNFRKDTVAPLPKSITLQANEDGAINLLEMNEFGSALVVDIAGVLPEENVEAVTIKDSEGNTYDILTGSGTSYTLNAVGLADKIYTIEVVTSDPAGNLRIDDDYEFIVDVVPPAPPVVSFEGSDGGLSYYETLNGLRVFIDVTEPGVTVDASTVEVNGTLIAPTEDPEVFVIDQSLLTGSGPNTLEYTIVSLYGTPSTPPAEVFDVSLDPNSVDNVVVVPRVLMDGANSQVDFKIYLTDTALIDNRFDDGAGTSVHMLVDLPDTFSSAAIVSVSPQFDDYLINETVSPGNFYLSGFTMTEFLSVTEPILIVRGFLGGDLQEHANGDGVNDAVVSMVRINGVDVSGASYDLYTGDLII